MARRTRLVLELGPSWISAIVVRAGRDGPVVTEPLNPELWEQHWTDRLRSLDAALARIVQSLEAQGAQTTLYHYGPEVHSDLFSCPGSPRESQAAALLSLAEQAGVDLTSNPHGVWPLMTETCTPPRQTHVLMAHDKQEMATIAAEWLDRAGLETQALIPADAPHINRLVTRLIQHPDPAPRLIMWIGSHHSAVVVGSHGRLGLLRRLDMGIETLVSATLKPAAGAHSAEDTITMASREEARQLLSNVGIPKPRPVTEEGEGTRGAKILPLLQPILQRWSVELKQSVRFGLAERERSGAKLTIIGPGAITPRLGEVLAEQTDLAIEPDPSPASEQTDLHAAMNWTPPGLNLLPTSLAQSAERQRVRRALYAGAAAALLVAGVSAAITMLDTQSVRERLDKLSPTISKLNVMAVDRDYAISQAAALERTLRGADSTLGVAPRWDAVLAELSLLTPQEVRLMDIQCSSETQTTTVAAPQPVPGAAPQPGTPAPATTQTRTTQSTLVLQGMVLPPAGDDVTAIRARLVDYVQALSKSPLFESVVLGGTERVLGDGRDTLRFTITARAVGHIGNPARADASQEITP